jgi:hypothetical protein
LVERQFCKLDVAGSIPATGTITAVGDGMIDTLTADSFEPHLGTQFAINVEGHEEVLTLVEVERQKIPSDTRAPFTLTFHGSLTDAMYESQMLPLDHAAMGRLELFVSPFGQNADGTYRYGAVFD